MCTYDGARFVEEQIASILAQTRMPDEIVVCDDRSRDETPAILDRLAHAAPIPIRWSVNENNLGSTANFGAAIAACEGDIIFLSDQDDVWLGHKVETMLAVFEREPEVAAVFSNLDVVDENLGPLGLTMFEHLRFTPEERERLNNGEVWNLLLDRSLVTGASFAFRRSLVPLALPIPTGHRLMIHDRWIATVAAAQSRIRVLDDRLVLYRQHAGQQLGVDTSPQNPERFGPLHRDYLAIYDAIWDRLVEGEPVRHSAALGRALGSRRAYYRDRLTLPASTLARAPRVISLLLAGSYHRHGSGFRSAGKDLLSPMARFDSAPASPER